MNIELYIGNKLCDLEKSDLSIRLKRQFVNPAELNVKDAQKSYTISLPSTPVNDEIFRYSNVEETEGKFSLYPDAELYVNGILIMKGKFRLTEIERDGYKGNLGVPAPLTAKEVFKEMKMNEIGEWKLSDDEVDEDTKMAWNRQKTISELNLMKNPVMMFPLAMYKLFNRNMIPIGGAKKQALDNGVNLKLSDIPPSINCMKAIKKIFSNAEYKLVGTALNDERLNALYMSYKNPNDYKTNWDIQNRLKIVGDWALYDEMNGLEENRAQHDVNQLVCNIFEGKNHSLKSEQTEDKDGWIHKSDNGFELVVPRDGVYKLTFDLSYNLGGFKHINRHDYNIVQGNFEKNGSPFEFLLIRKETDKELKEYQQVFSTAIGQRSKGVSTYQPCFVDNEEFISGYQMGKNDALRNDTTPSYTDQRACTPLLAENTAAYSVGYKIEGGGKDSKYKIFFKDGGPTTQIYPFGETFARGIINQLVYLKKGERLGMIDISTIHHHVTDKPNLIHQHNLTYTLVIEPFQKEKSWLDDQIDENHSTRENKPINWSTPDDYYDKELNITQFLPSETKVNDWLDNFCKAFNLSLNHVEDNTFRLDLKETKLEKNTARIIDLDNKTNIRLGQNEPLNLPMEYQLGFTVNNSEEGYYNSSTKVKNQGGKETEIAVPNTGEDGGGRWLTNSRNTNVTKQNSNFSYCWYKDIKGAKMPIPVITEHEVWKGGDSNYRQMMDKTYHNLPQRFWFKSGQDVEEVNVQSQKTKLALVSNSYKGEKPLELNYKNEPNSIMRNYFMLLTNERNYTTVECYLSPDEYVNLGNAYMKLNGDLYIVAEADGYDPMGRSKTKLKLIKKM